MALTPLDRPAESTQKLRYRGQVVSGEATATYPKTAGTFPSDSTIDAGTLFFTAFVRFPLFDPAGLTNTAKMLPLNVYDDEQPANAAPHVPVACVASVTKGINTTDKSMNLQTWAQNLDFRFNNIDTNVQLCDACVSTNNDPANGAEVLLDAANSGLGGTAGLPVVVLKFQVLTSNGARQNFNIDVTFEVQHSNNR